MAVRSGKGVKGIPLDQFHAAVMAELEGWSEDVQMDVSEAARETVKQTVRQLRATSPVGKYTRHSGRYARNWTWKDEGYTGSPHFIIHNETDYQLTHLLEFGHPIKSGGRTTGYAKAYPHIKAAEDFAIEYFQKRVEELIRL